MQEMPRQVRFSNPISRLDLVGAAAAFLCAVHCLALPLLLAGLPMAGFEALHSETFDIAFVVIALAFGVVVIARGYRRHRHRAVWGWFGAAFVLLPLGLTVFEHSAMHAWVLAIGGAALGWAHVLNLRYSRAHACGVAWHQHAA
jgi:hypothetical protein